MIKGFLFYLHDLIEFLCVTEQYMLLDDSGYCNCPGVDQQQWTGILDDANILGIALKCHMEEQVFEMEKPSGLYNSQDQQGVCCGCTKALISQVYNTISVQIQSTWMNIQGS